MLEREQRWKSLCCWLVPNSSHCVIAYNTHRSCCWCYCRGRSHVRTEGRHCHHIVASSQKQCQKKKKKKWPYPLVHSLIPLLVIRRASCLPTTCRRRLFLRFTGRRTDKGWREINPIIEAQLSNRSEEEEYVSPTRRIAHLLFFSSLFEYTATTTMAM